jgi:hypothetical protein
MDTKPWEGRYTDFNKLKIAILHGEKLQLPMSCHPFPPCFVNAHKLGMQTRVSLYVCKDVCCDWVACDWQYCLGNHSHVCIGAMDRNPGTYMQRLGTRYTKLTCLCPFVSAANRPPINAAHVARAHQRLQPVPQGNSLLRDSKSRDDTVTCSMRRHVKRKLHN